MTNPAGLIRSGRPGPGFKTLHVGGSVSAFVIDNHKTSKSSCTTSNSGCTFSLSLSLSLIIDNTSSIIHICFNLSLNNYIYIYIYILLAAVFNTDNNHTVVQTYNSTIYNLCDDSTSLDNDTVNWSSPDPSATNVHPVFVAVPLLKVGPTYFFSSDYDGEQCENGQRFSINVTHGQGLPPSLKTPSPEAPGPVGQQSGDDTVPETTVPANFDHPKDISDDDNDDDKDDGKKKKSNGIIIQVSRWGFSRVLIMLGLLYTCW